MNSNPDTSTAQAVIPADVLLNGGQTITVKNLKGETVEVKVRLVPIRDFGKYLDALGDLPKFVGFVTDKDEAAVDLLDDDAQYEIDALAKKLNAFRLARFVERQAVTLQEIGQIRQKTTGFQI